MTGGVVLSAALMGLAGAAHCAAMCAAPCGMACHAVAGEAGRRTALWGLVAGRVLSYAAGGAAAATVVTTLQWWAAGTAWLAPLWTLLQVALLALGLQLLVSGQLPRWLRSAAQSAATRAGHVSAFKGIPVVARGAALGSTWVLVPCGLLHGALLVAALGSSPLEGALAMAAFAATSSAGVVLGPRLWWRVVPAGGAAAGPVAGAGWIEPTTALRLAGATLVAGASFALMMRVWEPLRAWCA